MKKRILTFLLCFIPFFIYTQVIELEIHAFLEGSYNGVNMNTYLYDDEILPINQPYNSAPWEYNGSETLTAIPGTDIVDWVYIELRETEGDASTATPDKFFDEQAAILLSDGSIVQPDGSSLLVFQGTITQNLFVILYHRNHLPVMSATALYDLSGIYSYNFTDALSKAYMDGQKSIGSSTYGMISGDCDGNGIIEEDDKSSNWNIVAGEMGYRLSDLNLDGEVNNIDKDDFWITNLGREAQLPMGSSFICGTQISDIDGNTYNTVLIGDQCWMAENLKTTTYQNGTPIPNVTGMGEWSSLISGAYAWYENGYLSWGDYGALYNWYATVDANGLCPTGWSVPTNDEWTILTDYIGGTGSPHGNELKSCRQYYSPLGGGCNTSEHPRWNYHDTHYGTDDYGFSGLPGGLRSSNGLDYYIGGNCFWWSSTEILSNAWYRYLNYSTGHIQVYYDHRRSGFSVRCLRD